MSQYRHGVYVDEVETSLKTPVESESALPVIVGTAPVHNMPEGERLVNTPKLIYSMAEFTSYFGDLSESDNAEDYTLYQAVDIYCSRYGIAPIICINVFDPDNKHYTESEEISAISAISYTLATPENYSIEDDNIENEIPKDDSIEDDIIENEAPKDDVIEDDIIENEVPKDDSIEDDSIENEIPKDDSIENEAPKDDNIENEVPKDDVIEDDSIENEIPKDDSIENEAPKDDNIEDDIIENTTNKIRIPDVSLVTEEDIIGKETSEGRTGLFLIEEVFTHFSLVPALLLAPKFSADPTVALAIGARVKLVSTVFKCMGIFEVPDTITSYQDVPAWINSNNLIDPNLMCIFGSGYYADKVEPGSIHLAACIGEVDSENNNIPYHSPSNHKMQVESWYHAGKSCVLALNDANYLNGQGIITVLNFIGGFVCWGGQTTAYPSNTDVRDNSVPIRRMFTWLGNTLVLSSWENVSGPIRRRMIEMVQDTFNIWLNGLTAKEYILGGRVEFTLADNPTSDLLSGKLQWHIYFTPPQAAKEIVFSLEYDPDYLENLFS